MSTLRDKWSKWIEGKEEWEFDDYSDKELALAYEFARLFQADPPTIEQVSYFVEDGASIAGSVSNGPWTVRKSFDADRHRFMFLVLIDDILCGLEDGEGQSELEVLGKLPIEWEAAS